MENQTQPVSSNPAKPTLPNSTGVLVMGILSIVLCWCYGFPGLVLGIIALSMSGKSRKMLAEQPDGYDAGSVKNLNAGRVCAIIGTILSAIYTLIILVYIIFLGAVMSAMPWDMILENAQ